MSQHRGPLLLILCAVIFVSGGYASQIHKSAIHNDFGFHPGYVIYGSTSTDYWLGGIGNWSDPSYWNFGLPSGDSDVIIHSGGFDLVYLDTSTSIASLTLGGDSGYGSSQLIDNDTAQTLTIAGALTVNQTGTLYLASGSSVMAGADSSNAGLIQLENASVLQVNGNLSNAGTIFLGYLAGFMANNLTVTGTLTNGGLLQVGNTNNFYAGSATLGSLVNSGRIDLEAGTTLRVNGEGNNSGSMSLNGSEDGDLGSQAQFGSLVNSGSIGMAPVSNLIVIGNMNNTATGGLFLDKWDQLSVGGSLTNSGSISGWAAQLIIAGSLNNSGGIGLSNGTELVVNGDAINSGTIQISGDDWDQNPSRAQFGSLVNSGTIRLGYGYGGDFSAGSVTNTGTIAGEYPLIGGFTAVNLNNSGVISVASLEAGNVNNSGSIQLVYAQMANFTNSGDFSLSGYRDYESALAVHGNLINSGQFTADGSDMGTTVNIGGRLLNTPTGTVSISYSGNVFNAGSVVNQGTLFLDASNTFNVTGGPRAVGSALSGFLNTGIVNIGQNSTLNVVGNNYTQLAGQTTINGTLQVQGRGMVNFAGGSVYSEGGTISGPVFSNAAINIGDQLMSLGGPLTFLGNYTQGPNGSLTFDIAGTAPGEYDQLNISGHAQLNGLMTVDLLHGFVPDVGDAFDIMHFATESGTFSMVAGLPINGAEHFVLEYNPTDLTLDVVSGALLGADGEPILLASSAASEIASSIGMDKGSRTTSSIASDYGRSSPTPEPGTLLLLGSGLVCVGYSVRRRMTK